jgi:flagellar hook protein FlgE
MSFFGVPLSGLIASQDQLQSISSNLANLGTDGYKDQNDTFSDIFAQSSASNGAQDPIQTGLGVGLAETTSNFTNGSITSTNIPSNMALTGNGFFITKQSDGTTAYTRAGDFTTDNTGSLVDPTGGLVLGYPAVNGVVNTASVLSPLQIGAGSVSGGLPTGTFNTQTNLSAASPTGTVFNATPITLYDSLGNSHVLSMQFTKLAGTNTWGYSLDVPTADTGAATTQVSSGSMTFNSTGQLVSVTNAAGTVSTPPPSAISGISFPLVDGAATMTTNWDLTNASGAYTITQTNIPSATTVVSQDGNASGTLSSYSISADGTIEGSYSNGTTSALGQVAVANFINTQGLQRTGSNDYVATSGSGPALIGIAGTGGRGTITGGSVEGSNADTATEFAKLIVAQQDYQANAKTVTTFDQISQATIAMITA